APRPRRGRCDAWPVTRFPRAEVAEAGLCRRHRQVFYGNHRQARLRQPSRLGNHVDSQHRSEPERRTGDILHQRGFRSKPPLARLRASLTRPERNEVQDLTMSVADEAATAQLDAAETKSREHRAIGVASGAHALHDGYTDLVYVLLPLWQSEFALSYAA